MFLPALGYNPEMGGSFRPRADLPSRGVKSGVWGMGYGEIPKPALAGDNNYKGVRLLCFPGRVSGSIFVALQTLSAKKN